MCKIFRQTFHHFRETFMTVGKFVFLFTLVLLYSCVLKGWFSNDCFENWS